MAWKPLLIFRNEHDGINLLHAYAVSELGVHVKQGQYPFSADINKNDEEVAAARLAAQDFADQLNAEPRHPDNDGDVTDVPVGTTPPNTPWRYVGKKFLVQMLAFHEEPDTIRTVVIPEQTSERTYLDAVFHWGQNDFQPQPDRYSVSVGDVIEVGDKFFMVAPSGFDEFTADQLARYKKMPRRDRFLIHYRKPDELLDNLLPS